MNNYSLYIDNTCCSCKKAQQFITENNLLVNIVNIDNEKHKLPFSLMVIPALVKNKKLLAYGPDIILYLKKEIAES